MAQLRKPFIEKEDVADSALDGAKAWYRMLLEISNWGTSTQNQDVGRPKLDTDCCAVDEIDRSFDFSTPGTLLSMLKANSEGT